MQLHVGQNLNCFSHADFKPKNIHTRTIMDDDSWLMLLLLYYMQQVGNQFMHSRNQNKFRKSLGSVYFSHLELDAVTLSDNN